MNRKVYTIAKGHDGEWKGTLRGAARPSVSAPTKAEALERTVQIAKNAGLGQVVIRKQNGVIQSERTYGQDPKRYPG